MKKKLFNPFRYGCRSVIELKYIAQEIIAWSGLLSLFRIKRQMKLFNISGSIFSAFTAMLLLLALELHSQDIPYFQNYADSKGFPGSVVYDISDDSAGYIWFCTDNGLFRFNGYSYELYSHSEKQVGSLPAGLISTIHKDRSNNLWLGVGRDICLFQPESNNFKTFTLTSDSLQSFRVTSIFEDSDGLIYCCAEPYHLFRFHPKSGQVDDITLPSVSDAGTPIRTKDGFQDAEGIIWLASIQGLASLDPRQDTFHMYTDFPDSKHEDGKIGIVTSVMQDPLNPDYIYCGTWGNGLIHFEKKTGKITSFTYEDPQPSNLRNIIFDIEPRNENQIWLASHHPGYFDTNTKEFHFYMPAASTPREILDAEVRCIHTDQRGEQWFGTVTGASVIDTKNEAIRFRAIGDKKVGINRIIHHPVLAKKYLLNIYNSRSMRIADENWNILKSIPIPEADLLMSEPFTPFFYSDQILWIGTTRQGILSFNTQTEAFEAMHFHWPKEVDANRVYPHCFAREKNGRIWMGSMHYGLLSFDPATYSWQLENDRIYNLIHRNVSINEIEVDEEGNIWCLAANVGIISFNPATGFEAVYLQNDIQDFEITGNKSIAVCGNIRGAHILRYTDHKLQSTKKFATESGSPSNGFIDMCKDAGGNIWVLYSRGIVQLTNELDVLMHYADFSGLKGNLSESSLFCLDDQSVLLPYAGGIYMLPQKRNSNKYQFRPVVLTSLTLKGKPLYPPYLNSSASIPAFEHSENFFTFEFASLEYTQQNGLKYAYYLEGNDADWYYSGDRRNVTYADLSHGTYTLLVKVQSPDGSWGPAQAIYHFTILPAWWQTWVFRITVLIILLLSAFFIIRYFVTRRLRKQVEQMKIQRNIEHIRNRIARDIHDEIGAGLTKISLMSARLPESVHSEKIQTTSREIIENMGEIIWAVNPENDNLENLIAHIRDLSSRFFEDGPIHFQAHIQSIPKSLAGRNINPEIKRNIMLILKEALHNVIKHSHATECSVQLSFHENAIMVQVADNGQGLPEEINTSRNGLKNMEKRCRECEGKLEFQNSKHGLTLIFTIPI